MTCYDYSDEKSTVPCTVIKTSGNKFNLTCKVEDEIDCNLDNSILADGNKILIVDFEEGTNGNITMDPDDFETGTRRNYYHKSSGGLSGGLIALIIIIPIVLVAIVAALNFLLKKKSIPHNVIYNSNSVDNLNEIK